MIIEQIISYDGRRGQPAKERGAVVEHAGGTVQFHFECREGIIRGSALLNIDSIESG